MGRRVKQRRATFGAQSDLEELIVPGVGLSIWISRKAMRSMIASGLEGIDPGFVPFDPDAPIVRRGLTNKEAALELIKDIKDPEYDTAKADISRACRLGKIRSCGYGRNRRIDPESFRDWASAEADRHIAKRLARDGE
jgi:hypothetical protein